MFRRPHYSPTLNVHCASPKILFSLIALLQSHVRLTFTTRLAEVFLFGAVSELVEAVDVDMTSDYYDKTITDDHITTRGARPVC